MANFLCRFAGHDFVAFRDVHYTQVDEGVWTTLVREQGDECRRCGAKANVTLLRKK